MTTTILFDLDGTLFDTALDFNHILNNMRAEHNLPPMEFSDFRTIISTGSAAMTSYAFDMKQDAPEFAALLETFRQEYMEHMGKHAVFFPGVEQLLDVLDEKRIPWGIVTNRLESYIKPFLIQYGMHERPMCFVGADTTEHRKPHPAPLLHAATLMNTQAEHCLYVGDFKTDIAAANAAKMTSVAVTWGYTGSIADLEAMQPNHIIDKPAEILSLLAS